MTARKSEKRADKQHDVKRMQEIISNTKQNIEAAEESMVDMSSQQRSAIKTKNARREESIERQSEEMREETAELKGKK